MTGSDLECYGQHIYFGQDKGMIPSLKIIGGFWYIMVVKVDLWMEMCGISTKMYKSGTPPIIQPISTIIFSMVGCLL